MIIINSILVIFLLAICTESIVELIKRAGPIQPARNWIIKHTPFLYSKYQQDHLLSCPYCLSVWVACAVNILSFITGLVEYMNPIQVVIHCLCTHRLSNYIHRIHGIRKDNQIDIIIARKSRRG